VSGLPRKRWVISALQADPDRPGLLWRRVKLSGGSAAWSGRLAEATHDAAAVMLDGRVFVLGGRVVNSVPAIQALAAGGPAAVVGQLPGSFGL
jgi:hypothetical protein